MTTVRDIIERAYRKIGIKAEDEAISGDMLTNGVDNFNSMLFGWKIFGIDVLHVEQTAPDTFALGDEFVEGTIYQLAERLSNDFVVPAPSSDAFFRALQIAYLVMPTATLDGALTRPPSKAGY